MKIQSFYSSYLLLQDRCFERFHTIAKERSAKFLVNEIAPHERERTYKGEELYLYQATHATCRGN